MADRTRKDPAERIRDLLGRTTRDHVAVMQRLRSHYMVTERDEWLRIEMEAMLENVSMRLDDDRPFGEGNRFEGSAIAIIGESGAGKTTAMRHYLRRNPEFFPDYGVPHGECPLITVGVKAPCILRSLGMGTLRGASYRAVRLLQENEAWTLLQYQLMEQQLLFVHYEEAQRIIQQKNADERAKIIEALAGLLTDTEWPVNLIISGLPALMALFEADRDPKAKRASDTLDAHVTLRRRTRFVHFLPIDLGAHRANLRKTFKVYERIAKVRLGILDEASMEARVAHASARQVGLFCELVVGAIDVCLRAGRTEVAMEDFAGSYAARTLQPIDLNPFAGEHWEHIDTRIVQHKRGGDALDEGERERYRSEDDT